MITTERDVKAILARPEDHRGILAMSEAVSAMLDAFRNWAGDPLVGELRRRTHSPNNVRITLHQGGAPTLGVTGSMSHADVLMTNAWGQEELDKTAVFWEMSLDRPQIAGKIVDAGQVIRGEKKGRANDRQITYFKNSATWGVGAAAIGGLIYNKLREQSKGVILDFDAFEYYDEDWRGD